MTSARFFCALGLVVFPPSSTLFWWCYACGGISDLLDGPVARHMKTQGSAGARLDSAADFVFGWGIALSAVRYLSIPMWMWACICSVAVVRLAGCIIGYAKYHTFSALHTVLNKATGLLIFVFPVVFLVLGSTRAVMIGSAAALCAVAFASAVEEMVLTLTSRELDRDCRGFLFRPENDSGSGI